MSCREDILKKSDLSFHPTVYFFITLNMLSRFIVFVLSYCYNITMKKIFFLFVILSASLLSLSSAEKIRDYKETTKFISTLNKKFTVTKLDTVKYKNAEYPVYKISYNQLKEKGKKYLIICGVHGNEPAPVYAVKEFIISLSKKEIKRKDLQLDFIFIVNPFGFEYNQRNNGDNKDINRDMKKFETQEGKILQKHCKPKDYEKVFDFHEANSKGFFLYCYGTKNKKLSDQILNLLKENKAELDNSYKDNILTVEKGRLYVPFYASWYMKSKKTVTNGIYYQGCKNSFTFETSKNISLPERQRQIKLILNFILDEV